MDRFILEVDAPFACFTRPEFKVERMSYEVITPSAARAIFEAIYWRPQMQWRIVAIEVLNPIAFINVQRCEVAAMANVHRSEIFVEKYRQLRNSVLLRDVKYRITAQLIAFDGALPRHSAIFKRRCSKGQCFTTPYLGCREFSANWRAVDAESQLQPPINESRDLGVMLYDIDFSDPKEPTPQFFRAEMVNGRIDIA